MKKSILVLIFVIALLAPGCAKGDVSSAAENTVQENNDVEQPVFSTPDIGNLDEYMASVKEQADAIQASLEQDVLTQNELNAKSQELYVLWDDALNYLWGEIKLSLSDDEFEKLQAEQRIWITEKELAMEEAGKEFEGGSVYPLIVNSEAAKLTEARVYDLYALLKG